jgi:uncharacterized membrane protein
MKYTVQIEINKPIDQVVALFDNPENMKKWMKGLQSFETISGTPGWPGSKSRLVFITGNKVMEMIETITVRNLPEEFSGTYDIKGVHNIVKNRFQKISDTKTLYISEQEFRFKGIMRFVAMLMPAVFKRQSMQHLESFKDFVERSR